ncbi:MAG: hypothetical protein WCT50_04755 [Patescibacteria group bacterium]
MSIFTRYKKLFLVVLFLSVVIFLGYLLWRVFFQEQAITPGGEMISTSTSGGLPVIGPGGEIGGEITGPGNLPNGETPGGTSVGSPDPESFAPAEVANGGLTRVSSLTNTPVLNPTLSADGNVQYYNQDDGLFYKIDENGNLIKLSDKIFYQVDKIVWAPDKDRAIIEYPDGNKIMYNFATEKQVTIPAYWKDFSFADNSEQIVAKSISLDPKNNYLITSNSDGSKATALEPIGTNAATVYPSWSPNNQIVAMYTKGVDFDRQEIFFVGLNGENFKSTVVEGRGLQTQWSTAGDKLLYSVYHTRDDLKPRLWIVDASGDNIGAERHSFNLQTWANKCTFASNTEVYCAVPENLEAGAGMFPELADKTKDILYKIDLSTGTQKLIAIPDGAYNISQIMVPDKQDYLYFTDKSTEMIYKVKM